MTQATPGPRLSRLGALGVLLTAVAVTAALAAAAGYPLATALGGSDAGRAALVATLVVLVGAIAGAVPAALLLNCEPRLLVAGVTAGMVLRLIVTLALTVLLRFAGVGPDKAFLLAVAANYLVVLAAECGGLVIVLGRTQEFPR
jgi:hypothetical protein